MINNPVYPKPEMKDILEDDKNLSKSRVYMYEKAVMGWELDFCDNDELNDIINYGMGIAVIH